MRNTVWFVNYFAQQPMSFHHRVMPTRLFLAVLAAHDTPLQAIFSKYEPVVIFSSLL